MKHNVKFILALVFLVCSVPALAASTQEEIADLKAEVAELKMDKLIKGQEDMQKTLEEVKKLIESAAARGSSGSGTTFTEQVVDVGGSPFKGDEDAPLTLLEFSDYQCPFCSRFARDTMPKIIDEYVSTGKVKFVMKENPLTSIHKQAFDASLAALCAQDQGKYWDMHDIMFANMKQLSNEDLKAYAAAIELDAAEFEECLDSRKHEKRVNSDIAAASKMGVRGTPGFLLGVTDQSDPNKSLMKGYIRGAKSFEEFKGGIDDMLKEVN
ncbi:thioredoxin domain-containing protein [Pseudomonadota bacterium]